jgi:hypothetical protein
MNPNADFSIKEPFWRETWFYEQIVYVLVCLTPAMLASWHSLASKGPLTTRDAVLLVGTVLGAFMSVATAPTWWHLPSILWATFAYDLWRNHREARKDRKPELVIGGF